MKKDKMNEERLCNKYNIKGFQMSYGYVLNEYYQKLLVKMMNKQKINEINY